MNAMMDKINRLQTERAARSERADGEHESNALLAMQLEQYKTRSEEAEREVRSSRETERTLRERLVLLDRAEQHVREVEERARRSDDQARHQIEALQSSVHRLQDSERQMMSSNARDTEGTERQIAHFKAQLASLHEVENENTRSRSTIESLRLKLGDAERRAEDSVKALAAMKYSAAEQITALKANLADANQRMEAHLQVSETGDREALAQLRAAQNELQALRAELEVQKGIVVDTRKEAFAQESKLREELLQSVLSEKAHAHDEHVSSDRQVEELRAQLTSAERARGSSAAEVVQLQSELDHARVTMRKLQANQDEQLERLSATRDSSSTLEDELVVAKEKSQHLLEEREIEQAKYRHKVHELTERVHMAERKGHEILEAYKHTKDAHLKVRQALELQHRSELHKVNEQLDTLRASRGVLRLQPSFRSPRRSRTPRAHSPMRPCVVPTRALVGIAFEDEKEEAASLRERLGSTTAEGEDMQAMVKILQARTEELEVSNARLKKKVGAGRLHTSKPTWGGTSSHNEEFSRVRWSGVAIASLPRSLADAIARPPPFPRAPHRFLPMMPRWREHR